MILLFSLILLPLFSFICSILFSNLVNKKILGYFSSILIIIAFFSSLFSSCCYCDSNDNSSATSYFILAILFFNLAAFSYILLFLSSKEIPLENDIKNFLGDSFQKLSPESISGTEVEKNLTIFDTFIRFLNDPIIQETIYYFSFIVIGACLAFLFDYDQKGGPTPPGSPNNIKPGFATESNFPTLKTMPTVVINPFTFPKLNFVELSFLKRKDLLLRKVTPVYIIPDNIIQGLQVELVKILSPDFLHAISQISACYVNNKESYFFF